MKNLKKYIAAIIIFVFLLTSCQNTPEPTPSGTLNPVTTIPPEPTPTEIPVTLSVTPVPPTEAIEPTLSPTPVPTEALLEATATPTPEPTSTPTPTPSPTPTIAPEVIARTSNYVNYSNGLPFAFTDLGSVQFSYSDEIVLKNTAGESLSLLLSETITAENCDFTDADSWFFCGAFVHENMIYAHYDYFDNNDRSLLLKIQPENFAVNLCILSTNPQKQFSDTFVAIDQHLYYTYTTYTSTGTPRTGIYRADLDGNNSERWFKGASKEVIPQMSTNGSLLYCIVMESDETYRLISIDPSTAESNTIAKNINTVDFLYLVGNYAVTSLQNNKLNYYNVTTNTAAALKVTDTSSLTTGSPMTDGIYLYVPVFSYSGSSGTTLIKLNLAWSKVIDELTLSDSYYYSLGIIDQTLYTESYEDYKLFDLTE